MTNVTRILSRIEQGDRIAAGELLPLVYEELRKLAAAKLSQEKPGQTLQATALVHEAYIRLVDADQVSNWENRGHFFAAAAEAMRRILIEQFRRKQSLKRGAGRQRQCTDGMSEVAVADTSDPLDLLALDEALQKLERDDSRKAELVKLRYFAGLTLDEAAKVLGVSPSTASADWLYAKSWLRLEMRSDN